MTRLLDDSLTDAEQELVEAFLELADGKAVALGWGVLDSVQGHLAQCSLPVRWIVDSKREKWGTKCGRLEVRPPSTILDVELPVVVVSFLFGGPLGAAVEEQARALGARWVIPAGCYAARCFPRSRIDGLLARASCVPWATQFARLVEGAAALNAIADVERRGSILGERSSRPLGLASVDVLLPFFSIGGAERQACDLARGLAADGVECRLLTLRAPSTHLYNEELQSASIELITLEQPEYSAALDLLRAVASGFEDVRVVQFVESLPPGVARDIAALVRYYHERPRTLVAYLETAGIVGAIAGVLIGAPAIVVALLSVSPERFTVAREDLSWLREALCAAGRNHAVRFVANSAFGASECSRWLLGAHVRVARNAGAEDLLAWDVQSMRIMVRETLGLPQDARLVVGVFRLSPEKRPHLFVEVASVLNHHLPGTRFVIVGDGPLTESTRRSVTEAGLDRALRIIERSDGRSFIAAADLLVHVSAIEGIPNVLLEAQFLGVPFVACDVGGLREGVAPCLDSYVLDDDDPQPLARAALDLLLDAEKSRRLGEQARREVQAQFSRRRLATDTMNHVEGVLQAVETFSRNGTADS